ncbi:hypothetical protein JCM19233_243 [Vibrio astriarenae]|nr:hypothetical protein JCM19233_243 [Vibrio sp. C7]
MKNLALYAVTFSLTLGGMAHANEPIVSYSLEEVVSISQLKTDDLICITHVNKEKQEQKLISISDELVKAIDDFDPMSCIRDNKYQWKMVTIPDTLGYEIGAYGSNALLNESNNSYLSVTDNNNNKLPNVYAYTEEQLEGLYSYFLLSLSHIKPDKPKRNSLTGSIISIKYSDNLGSPLYSGYNNYGSLFVNNGELRANGQSESESADYLKIYKLKEYKINI